MFNYNVYPYCALLTTGFSTNDIVRNTTVLQKTSIKNFTGKWGQIYVPHSL